MYAFYVYTVSSLRACFLRSLFVDPAASAPMEQPPGCPQCGNTSSFLKIQHGLQLIFSFLNKGEQKKHMILDDLCMGLTVLEFLSRKNRWSLDGLVLSYLHSESLQDQLRHWAPCRVRGGWKVLPEPSGFAFGTLAFGWKRWQKATVAWKARQVDRHMRHSHLLGVIYCRCGSLGWLEVAGWEFEPRLSFSDFLDTISDLTKGWQVGPRITSAFSWNRMVSGIRLPVWVSFSERRLVQTSTCSCRISNSFLSQRRFSIFRSSHSSAAPNWALLSLKFLSETLARLLSQRADIQLRRGYVSLGHLSGKKSKAQVQQCIFCGRRYSNVRLHVLCACTCFVNFRQQCTTHFSSGLDIDMSSLNIPPSHPGYRPIIALFAHEVVRPAQYFLEGVKQLQVGWSCEGLAAASRFHVGAPVLPQAGVGKHNLPAEEKVAWRWCGSFWGRGGRHMFGCQRRSPVGGANYARGSCRPLSKEGRRCFLSHPILPHLCPSQFWRLGRWCSFLGWLPLCWQSFSSKKASQFRMDPRCFPSHRFRSRRRSSTMSEGPQVCLCDPEPTNQPTKNQWTKVSRLKFLPALQNKCHPVESKGKMQPYWKLRLDTQTDFLRMSASFAWHRHGSPPRFLIFLR